MKELINEVSHKKFNLDDILIMETDILTTIGFKIQAHTLFEEIWIKFQLLLSSFHNYHLTAKEQNQVKNYIGFLCKLVLHKYNLSS